MNINRSNFWGLGIAALVIVMLVVVVLAVQSIPRGPFGQSSAGPYPILDGPYPPPHSTSDPNGYITATAEEAALLEKIPTIEPGPTLIPTPRVTPVSLAKMPLVSPGGCPTAGPGAIFFRQGSALMALEAGNKEAETLVDVQDALGLFLAGDGVGVHNTDWISTSPDGQQIALVLSSDPGPWERGQPLIQVDIYLYDRKTGIISLLVKQATQPAWSPDGGRIAYRSGGNLWLMDLETDKAREIYRADVENEHYVDSPEWSPDGSALVFVDTVFRQETILKTLDAATGEVLLEVEHPLYFLYIPLWSPDGEHILYFTSDGESSTSQKFVNLWLITSDGSKRSQITRDITTLGGADWSPRGDWIAFAGLIGYEQADGDYDLWVVDPQGSELRRITATEGISELSPVWSPDCTSLYFSTDDGVMKKLSLMDGTEQEVQTAEGKFVISN